MASIQTPCLCLVTDGRFWQPDPRELERKVDLAIGGGVNAVQLREKGLAGGPLLELARGLRRVTDGRALLFINERVDVAVACGADGVQLGEDGLPAEAARRVAGPGLLIGRSVHTAKGAVTAEQRGADFLLVGTVFTTRSHSGGQSAGTALLAEVAGHVTIPFAGIGGITSDNVDRVMEAGAAGAAVISAILGADDPYEAARELRSVMDDAVEKRPVSGGLELNR
jgi:thiamine-phosphate pyrophosphorylase